jgi:hypothetical protein
MDINGHMRKLSDFAGKVLLIVNVASHCGFTDSNYKGERRQPVQYLPCMSCHGIAGYAAGCHQQAAAAAASKPFATFARARTPGMQQPSLVPAAQQHRSCSATQPGLEHWLATSSVAAYPLTSLHP